MTNKFILGLRLGLILFACCLFLNESLAQEVNIKNLYGQWVNTGSFHKGEQVLEALKEQKNPKIFYFTIIADGTFTYDPVSLDSGTNTAKRTGKWFLSPNKKRITLIDDAINAEERKIPGDFLNFKTDGSLASKPFIFPILELSPKKLVLYDEYHKTRDVYRKE